MKLLGLIRSYLKIRLAILLVKLPDTNRLCVYIRNGGLRLVGKLGPL